MPKDLQVSCALGRLLLSSSGHRRYPELGLEEGDGRATIMGGARESCMIGEKGSPFHCHVDTVIHIE